MGKYAGGLEQQKGEEGYQLVIAFHTPNVKRWCARGERKIPEPEKQRNVTSSYFFPAIVGVSGKKQCIIIIR